MCRSLMLVLALALTALAPRSAGAGPLGMTGSDILSPDGVFYMAALGVAPWGEVPLRGGCQSGVAGRLVCALLGSGSFVQTGDTEGRELCAAGAKTPKRA